MKLKTISCLCGLAATLTGCVVTSVHPFYTAQDVAFEPALLGRWLADDPANSFEFKKAGDDHYQIVITEKENKSSESAAYLFKLDGQLFLDHSPTNPPDLALLPLHQISKVTMAGDTFTIASMRYEWLRDQMTNSPAPLRHEVVTQKDEKGQGDSRIVLTASTQDLQQFILRNVNTDRAWENPTTFHRAPRPAPADEAPATTPPAAKP